MIMLWVSKKHVDITVDDNANDHFIRLVKCDVVPPKESVFASPS